VPATGSCSSEIGNGHHSGRIRGCVRSRGDRPRAKPKPIEARRQHNGSCDLRARRLDRKANRNFAGTGSQRLEDCALVNPSNPMHRLVVVDNVSSTPRSLGVALPIVEATTAEELDTALASAAAQHADAIIVFGDSLTNQEAPRVSDVRFRGSGLPLRPGECLQMTPCGQRAGSAIVDLDQQKPHTRH
jgi:hypothetical protein